MPRGSRTDRVNARWRAIVGVLVAGLSLPMWGHAQERPLTTVSGEILQVRSGRWLEGERWEFAGPRTAKATLSLRELVAWGAPSECLTRTHVVLVDGSVLVGELLRVQRQQLDIGTDPRSLARPSMWQDLRLARERVAGVVLHSSGDPRTRDRRWTQMLRGERTQDELWLDNGDRIAGTLADFDAAVDEVFRIVGAAGPLQVARNRVQAVLLRQTRRSQPLSPTVVLGFRDGSLLRVEQLSSQNNLIAAELGDGLRATARDDEFGRELCHVRSLLAPVRYLSDQDPVSYRHIPLLTLQWTYGRDESVARGRLRASWPDAGAFWPGTQWHEKGLGMHATSSLAYDVPPRSRRLDAAIALDASAGGQGSVVFRVYGATPEGQFQPAFESPVMRGGQPPQNISVDVTPYQRIALIVDSADGLDIRDRADWLLARWVLTPENATSPQ